MNPARAAWAVAGKEFRDILRERAIMVALIVQLFVAGFSTLLSVGLMGLYDPASVHAEIHSRVAFEGSPALAQLLEADNFEVQTEPADVGLSDFHAGRVAAVVEESATHTVTLVVADGEIQTTLLVTQVQGVLEAYELDLRTSHQTELVHPVQSVEVPLTRAVVPFSFLYGTLWPILLFTPIFLAGAIAGDSLQHELQTHTLGLLRSAPMSLKSLLAGKLVAPLLVAPAQVILWAALLDVNHAPVHGLLILLPLTSLLAGLVASLGLAVTAAVGRPGASQAAYAVLVLALAVLSLTLPRTPLNLVAALATGLWDASVAASLVAVAAFCVVVAGGALWFAHRRLRDA
ncbi:MAG: ABC transporter permease subunit [Thermoplasmatota archaeon]